MAWTLFWDMHSGGRTKELPYNKIYIEASEKESIVIFYNRFGHNPHRITCTCCGEDYSVTEGKTLKELTVYHRNARRITKGKQGKYLEGNGPVPTGWKKDSYYTGKTQTVKDYCKMDTVLIVRKDEIKPDERTGTLPTEGYIWA